MSLSVKLKAILWYYLEQINLVLDVTFSMYYILKNEYIKIQDILKTEEYLEKFKEYLNIITKLDKSPDGTGIYLSNEHQEIYDLQKRLALSLPKLNLTMNMTLIYLMALFEAFNKLFFSLLFSEKPELMKSKEKSITYDDLLEFETINTLHEYLAEQETEKFGRIDIDKFCNEIERRFNIHLNEELENWESLRENYYRRNIIVHNDGMISDIYLEKMKLTPENLNRIIISDDNYLIEAHKNLKNYMIFIFNRIKEKFNLDTRVRRFASFPPSFDKPMIVKQGKDEILNDKS